jgi:twitching motility protein PilJ
VSAREAQALVVADSRAAAQGPGGGAGQLADQGGLSWCTAWRCCWPWGWWWPAAGVCCACTCADQAQRAGLAEAQRLEAERQEREAKRVNDANQAAILRLMNELQTVAEGDLTQQATVTEDITGAIADSVNYTVEELRSLVARCRARPTG